MLQRGIRLFSILKRKGAFFKMAKAPEEEPEKPKAEPSRAAINFDKSYLKTLNDIGLKPKKEQKPAQQATKPAPKKRVPLLNKLQKVDDTESIANKYYEEAQDKQIKKSQVRQSLVNTFLEGEEGIQKTPVLQEYSMKPRHLLQTIKHTELETGLNMENQNGQVSIIDPTVNAERLREVRQIYVKEMRKNDLNDFLKVAEAYPGSMRGPEPEDDPEAFDQYLAANAPKSILHILEKDINGDMLQRLLNNRKLTQKQQKIMNAVTIEENSQIEEEEERASEDESNSEADWNMLSGIPYEQNGVFFHQSAPDAAMHNEFDPEEMADQETQMEMFGDSTIQSDYDDLPTMPTIKYRNYQAIWHPIIDWSQFKIMRELTTYSDSFEKALGLAVSAIELDPIEPQPVQMGSLYYYYRTLPKNIQQNSAIRDIYLGLEFSCPEKTLKEKEQALNYAAFQTLPLDAIMREALEEHLKQPHMYNPTPKDMDRIYNMKPEFTWDIHDYVNEIKEEKLRGEVDITKVEDDFDFPEAPVYSFQVPEANLPIDFYDNQDGFWDDYIKHKTAIYERSPLQKHRPYLKH